MFCHHLDGPHEFGEVAADQTELLMRSMSQNMLHNAIHIAFTVLAAGLAFIGFGLSDTPAAART